MQKDLVRRGFPKPPEEKKTWLLYRYIKSDIVTIVVMKVGEKERQKHRNRIFTEKDKNFDFLTWYIYIDIA